MVKEEGITSPRKGTDVEARPGLGGPWRWWEVSKSSVGQNPSGTRQEVER